VGAFNRHTIIQWSVVGHRTRDRPKGDAEEGGDPRGWMGNEVRGVRESGVDGKGRREVERRGEHDGAAESGPSIQFL